MAHSIPRTPRVALDAAQRAELLAFAERTARAAGDEILTRFRERLDVVNKLEDGRFDPVTEADRRGEEVVRAAIDAEHPSHGILGEEFGHREGDGLTWVIDPIDGTRAFMTGMVHWGVLLGLFDGEQPVLGVMVQPYTGEVFRGDGERAWLTRGGATRALEVRPCARLEDASLCVSSPHFYTDPGELRDLGRLEREVRLTRYGGDCYIFAMLAAGQLDLVLETGLNPYDILPLIPIIRGAGGVVTDWAGGDGSMGGRILAAGDARLHGLAMDLLRGEQP